MPLICKAVIFDLDGVLIDSNPIVERHWQLWAEKHDLPYEKIEAIHHGRPTIEVIREVAPQLDAAAEADKKAEREARDMDGLRIFEGARTLIDRVPDGQWTIATSGRRRTATNRLRHVGLPVPKGLVTADDVDHGKPAPDPYLLAAERLEIDPTHCLVLEDAPAGIKSAHRAGAKVIAVASTNPPEALASAEVVVPSLAALTIESREDGELRVAWREEAGVVD